MREGTGEGVAMIGLYHRTKKRIGAWLCRHELHKWKKVIGLDYAYKGAPSGVMCFSRVCKRCTLIIVDRYETVGKAEINIIPKSPFTYICTICRSEYDKFEDSKQCLIECSHKLRDEAIG